MSASLPDVCRELKKFPLRRRRALAFTSAADHRHDASIGAKCTRSAGFAVAGGDLGASVPR